MKKGYRIEVSPTHIEQSILVDLHEQLVQNINNSRKSVEKFQQKLAGTLGGGKVLAVNSGTAALHLSLLSLGIKAGDLVACSTFTFAATVNAISYINAIPILIDSEETTWNMCPELLKEAIEKGIQKGKSIKAVIVVHSYGFPANMDQIMGICTKYGIPVIEDAASALGSTYKNISLGTIGTAGIISFNYNKIITTTGGGAFISESEDLIEKATFYANQAKSESSNVDHLDIGYNYKISGISAELGILQLPYLAKYVHFKRSIYDMYYQTLNNIDGIKFLEEPDGYFSNRWITTIFFKEKSLQEEIKLFFEKNKIEVRNLWKPMHMQPVFQSCSSYCNGVSENLFHKGLCLPSGLNLKKSDQENIINILHSFF